jgi:hypothetical protein
VVLTRESVDWQVGFASVEDLGKGEGDEVPKGFKRPIYCFVKPGPAPVEQAKEAEEKEEKK